MTDATSLTLSTLYKSIASQQPLKSGSRKIDHSIRGGIKKSRIYEISGVPGSGYKEIVQSYVFSALSQNHNVLICDSNQLFPISRLSEYEAFDLKFLELIKHLHTPNICQLIVYIMNLMKDSDTKRYDLIVIDDIAQLINLALSGISERASTTKTHNGKKVIHYGYRAKKNQLLQDLMILLTNYTLNFSCSVILVGSLTTMKINSNNNGNRNKSGSNFQLQMIPGIGEFGPWTSYLSSRITTYYDWATDNDNSTSYKAYYAIVRSNNNIRPSSSSNAQTNSQPPFGSNSPTRAFSGGINIPFKVTSNGIFDLVEDYTDSQLNSDIIITLSSSPLKSSQVTSYDQKSQISSSQLQSNSDTIEKISGLKRKTDHDGYDTTEGDTTIKQSKLDSEADKLTDKEVAEYEPEMAKFLPSGIDDLPKLGISTSTPVKSSTDVHASKASAAVQSLPSSSLPQPPESYDGTGLPDISEINDSAESIASSDLLE